MTGHLDAPPCLDHAPVAADQEGRSVDPHVLLAVHALLDPGAERLDHPGARVIGRQREAKRVLLLELVVAGDGVLREADDLDAGTLELRVELGEGRAPPWCSRACRPWDRDRGRRVCPSGSPSRACRRHRSATPRSGRRRPRSGSSRFSHRAGVTARPDTTDRRSGARRPGFQQAVAARSGKSRALAGSDGSSAGGANQGLAQALRRLRGLEAVGRARGAARRAGRDAAAAPGAGASAVLVRAGRRRGRPRRSTAAVAGSRRLGWLVPEGELQELGAELDLDQPAAGMLQVPGVVRAVLRKMRSRMARTSRARAVAIARAPDGGSDGRVSMPAAELGIAGHDARPGQRLLLPGLRRFHLVAGEVPERARRPARHCRTAAGACRSRTAGPRRSGPRSRSPAAARAGHTRPAPGAGDRRRSIAASSAHRRRTRGRDRSRSSARASRACRSPARRSARPATRPVLAGPATPRHAAAASPDTTSAMAVSAWACWSAALIPRRTCSPAWNWRPCAQRRQMSSTSCRSRASGSLRASSRAQGRGVRQRLEEVGRQHGVEQVDIAAQEPGEAWGRSGEIGQQRQQARIGAEQREELHARRQAADELVEQAERRIGIGLSHQRLEDRRRQLGQQLAGPGAPRGADMAMVPVADPLRHRRRVLEAHSSSASASVSGWSLGAGEHQRPAAAEVGLLLEQGGIVVFDGLQPAAHHPLEGSRIREAGEGREPGELGIVLRQDLGLTGRPPSAAGARPSAGSGRPRSAPGRALVDPPSSRQCGERLAGHARAQLRRPSARG